VSSNCSVSETIQYCHTLFKCIGQSAWSYFISWYELLVIWPSTFVAMLDLIAVLDSLAFTNSWRTYLFTV